MFVTCFYDPFLQSRALVAGHEIVKIHLGVAAVHQRLCEDCVNFPGLDEDSREHEVRAKDSVELEEDAGVLIERAVEEQNPGDLTHKGASEKEGEIM